MITYLSGKGDGDVGAGSGSCRFLALPVVAAVRAIDVAGP